MPYRVRKGILFTVLAVILSMLASFIPSSDAAGEPTSSNLEDFLTSAKVYINGRSVSASDPIEYKKGDTLKLEVTFNEKPNLQFGDTELVFNLPDAFKNSGFTGTHTFNVPINTGSGVRNLEGNTWTIENGKIIVRWNKQSPYYNDFLDALDAHLTISPEFSLDETNLTNVNFGSITLNFKPQENTSSGEDNLSVNKSVNYIDQDKGIVQYTVAVKSSGQHRNVVVKDTVTGSALKYNQGSITYSGNSATPAVQENGDGFTLTFPSMTDGETVYINYTANIDYDKIAAGVTSSNSANKVTVTPTDPTPGDNEKTTDLTKNHVERSRSNKTGKVDSSTLIREGSQTYREVEWTINANTTRHLSIAGKTISDSLDAASLATTSYSGSGVTVKVYDENGTYKETRQLSWSQLGVTSSSGQWNYTIPAGDGKYSYEFTYKTRVEVTDALAPVTVKNTVTTPYNDPQTSQVNVNPEFTLEAEKKVVQAQSDNDKTTWTINVKVPQKGYNSLLVDDTLPNVWIDKQYYDSYVAGSLQVAGLVSGESYSVDESQAGHVKITFYKDSNKSAEGLQATSVDRTLVLTLVTKNNAEWMDKASPGYQQEHKNTARVRANHTEVETSATRNPHASSNVTITKKSEPETSYTIDGVSYPMYKFTITLTGLNSTPLEIDDTFDTSLFKYADPSELGLQDWQALNGGYGYISGGNQYYIGFNPTKVSYKKTDTGVLFTVNDLPKDGEQHYSHYALSYYLIAKDAAAIKKLNQKAYDDGGTATFENTATIEDKPSTSEFSHSYKDSNVINKGEQGYDPDTRKATFSITINAGGVDLDPDSDTVTMTDAMSKNLFLDVSTIKASPSEGVTYNYDTSTNTMTFRVPDGKRIEVTYEATLSGKGDENGDENYSNTATVGNTKSTVSKTHNVKGTGEGSASVPGVNIFKYTYGSLKQTVPNAVFGLYKADGTPVRDKSGNPVTFKSDDKGIVEVHSSPTEQGWTLDKNVKYSLVELSAPDGYEKRNDGVEFTLADVADPENNVYAIGSVIPYWNKRENIRLIKVDADDSNKKLRGAQFRLKNKGATATQENYDETRTSDSNGVLGFNGLVPGTYELEEIKAPDGYSRDEKVYTIVVDENLKISSPDMAFTVDSSTGAYSAEFKNTTSFIPAVLPSAGGPGLVLLYSAGIVLLAISAFAEYLRRKRGQSHSARHK